VPATNGLELLGYGPEVFAEDRRLLEVLAAMASRAWQGQHLAEQAEQRELLLTVEESTDRLGDLISNLLAMTRIQAGAVSVQIGPVALDEVVARALLGTEANVTIDVPEDLPWVLADAGLLERVVANLVDNARRFSPPDVPVRVHADLPDAVDEPDRGPRAALPPPACAFA
jgi:K+-sensing histidine kinase KdpD